MTFFLCDAHKNSYRWALYNVYTNPKHGLEEEGGIDVSKVKPKNFYKVPLYLKGSNMEHYKKLKAKKKAPRKKRKRKK